MSTFRERNNNRDFKQSPGPRGDFKGNNNKGDRRDFKKDFRGREGGDQRPRPAPGKPNFRGQPGGSRVMVKQHQAYPGCYISSGKQDTLVTRSFAPGVTVYGEKKIQVEEKGEKIEYREWNPFRSKLGAAILCRVGFCPVKPGVRVLYLGAASGTTVSHVSDIVGATGIVYAVEFSKRSGRDLLEMAKNRSNVLPIIADARHPYKYRMIVPQVDCIFSDVAQPDQAKIVIENAKLYLKSEGGVMISIKASSVDSTAAPERVFEQESQVLREGGFRVDNYLKIDEFHKNHAILIGKFKKD